MIIHIGLGKTGTTTAQKYIFPYLKEKKIIDEYNPPRFMSLLRKLIVTGDGLVNVKKELNLLPINTVISLESLSNWNPCFWEDSLQQNLDIFPRESTILITFRDPLSYVTSVYIQNLQQGNILSPNEYFIDNRSYSLHASIMNAKLQEIFKVDDLDYCNLIEIYKREFKEVVVVTMESLLDTTFFKEYFNLEKETHLGLKKYINNVVPENKSYSDLSIKLTKLREKILNYFGLKSMTTQDVLRYRHLIDKIEVRSLIGKIMRRIKKYIQWRYLMQNVVDRLMPYKKYKLPESVYKGIKYQSNKDFYKWLSNTEYGYKIYTNRSEFKFNTSMSKIHD